MHSKAKKNKKNKIKLAQPITGSPLMSEKAKIIGLAAVSGSASSFIAERIFGYFFNNNKKIDELTKKVKDMPNKETIKTEVTNEIGTPNLDQYIKSTELLTELQQLTAFQNLQNDLNNASKKIGDNQNALKAISDLLLKPAFIDNIARNIENNVCNLTYKSEQRINKLKGYMADDGANEGFLKDKKEIEDFELTIDGKELKVLEDIVAVLEVKGLKLEHKATETHNIVFDKFYDKPDSNGNRALKVKNIKEVLEIYDEQMKEQTKEAKKFDKITEEFLKLVESYKDIKEPKEEKRQEFTKELTKENLMKECIAEEKLRNLITGKDDIKNIFGKIGNNIKDVADNEKQENTSYPKATAKDVKNKIDSITQLTESILDDLIEEQVKRVNARIDRATQEKTLNELDLDTFTANIKGFINCIYIFITPLIEEENSTHKIKTEIKLDENAVKNIIENLNLLIGEINKHKKDKEKLIERISIEVEEYKKQPAQAPAPQTES